MNQLTISPNWTDQERLQVIKALAVKIDNARMSFVPAHVLIDLGQTIRFVASATPEFLETNREQIMRDAE